MEEKVGPGHNLIYRYTRTSNGDEICWKENTEVCEEMIWVI